MNNLHKELKAVSDKYHLIEACHAAFRIALGNCTADEKAMGIQQPWLMDDITAKFSDQVFVIQSSLRKGGFIRTRLDLFVQEEKIGWYALDTLLNGEDIDDWLVFGAED